MLDNNLCVLNAERSRILFLNHDDTFTTDIGRLSDRLFSNIRDY